MSIIHIIQSGLNIQNQVQVIILHICNTIKIKVRIIANPHPVQPRLSI